MKKDTTTRRGFLKTTAALVAAGVAMPTLIPWSALAQGRRVGANDRIIVGFVGSGGRASQLMPQIPPERAKIVAISDAWYRKTVEAVHVVKAVQEPHMQIDNIDEWKLYGNYEEMYDKEKLDCVFNATPDHVRSLATIRAMMAGLDVFAEKALTTYIAEGREMVKCTRKLNRVFQVGSHQRTMRLNEYGCRLVREGSLGAIRLVQACNYPGGNWIPEGLKPYGDIPSDLDWDAWQGPTGYRGYNGAYLDWRWWREYANGDLTLWGAHGFDQIQWALGADDTGPVELWPLEGQEGVDPRRMKIGMKYANGVEVRCELEGSSSGGIFRCASGNLEIARNSLRANPESLIAGAPERERILDQDGHTRLHIENFFDCMFSREKPNADVEIGHRTATVCHLVSHTRDLNRRLKWDPVKEQFIDDDEANKLVDRPRRKGYEFPAY